MLYSGWIRSEDLKKYEDIGIYNFKIEGRGVKPDIMLKSIKSYVNMYYKGSVFDVLFTGIEKRKSIGVYLDNNLLNEFMER